MSIEQFKKPQFQKCYTPELAFDEIFNPKDLLPKENENNVYSVKGRDICWNTNVVFKYIAETNQYQVTMPDTLEAWGDSLKNGEVYRPHQIMLMTKYKGDYTGCRNFILYEYLDKDIPYFRIGTKYFKIVKKETRYGTIVDDTILWSKEAIVDDFGKTFLKRVLKFNGFTCRPNNLKYEQMHEGFYNMYKPFPHKPVQRFVTLTDIPTISGLINHIFGEQQELGYQYLKILYEMPWQKLPVLCLVSEARQSGKTTFLNFLQILFGSNFGVINSETLTSAFNSSYAHLNIIGIDETVIEKSAAVEKIKMIATADTLMVNMKNVQEYPVEFFGKVVLATNKEKDFMRIDTEEIRFWIRKPEKIKKTDPDYFDKLVKEIPLFLSYLNQIEMPEFKTRMVFTPEDLDNEQLQAVKSESKSSLYKEINILIREFLYKNKHIDVFHATPTDIKKRWFDNDSRTTINYISKVLRDEFKLEAQSVTRYIDKLADPRSITATSVGRPYEFERYNFISVTDDDTLNKNYKENNNIDLGGYDEAEPF